MDSQATVRWSSTLEAQRRQRSAADNRAAARKVRSAFDAQTYRSRKVIERSFNTIKQWRGLAARHDKLAIVYRGATVLRASSIWLKHL